MASVAAIALSAGACATSFESAEATKKAAAQKQLKSAKSLTNMGDAVARRGDPATAARFYQSAAKAAPKDPKVALRLARAYQAMGAHAAAVEAFKKTLVLRPGDPEAERGMANSLIALDRPNDAIAHYRSVIERTRDYRAFNGLGVALDMVGNHKGAVAAYRAGLAENPSSLSLKNNLALSMALTGKYKPATRILREVAEDPRATIRHRQNLALVYGLAGQSRKAARVARADLDSTSVARNLAYYAWLRKQPRWMVNKMIRGGKRPTTRPTARANPPRAKVRTPVVRARPASYRGEARVQKARLDYGYKVIRRGGSTPAGAKPAAVKPATAKPATVKPARKTAPRPKPVVKSRPFPAPMPKVVRGNSGTHGVKVVRGGTGVKVSHAAPRAKPRPEAPKRAAAAAAKPAPNVRPSHFTRRSETPKQKVRFLRSGVDQLLGQTPKR